MATPALRQAMELLRTPTLAGAMRQRALPDDVLTLIRIAAGDAETIGPAAAETAEPTERIGQAAILYLQSVVFTAGTDHYRTLAVPPDAPQEQIRLHLSWLMKWLHPDRAGSEWAAAFARRVLVAWDALKTRDRRAAYDRLLAGGALRRGRGGPVRTSPAMPAGAGIRSGRYRAAGPAPARRMRGLLAVGLCLVLATVIWVASGGLSGRFGEGAASLADDDGIGVVSALSDRSTMPAVAKAGNGAH